MARSDQDHSLGVVARWRTFWDSVLRNPVGGVGFIVTMLSLLAILAGAVVVFPVLLGLQQRVDEPPPTLGPVVETWIVVLRCSMYVCVFGFVMSVVGVRSEPRRLAAWGAALGVLPAALLAVGLLGLL